MMRAFLSKPKVPQESVEEASKVVPEVPHESEAVESPSTNTTGTPDSIVTNEVFTGYISDVEEDEDDGGNPHPDGAGTRELEPSQPVAGSSSCAERNPEGTNNSNSLHGEREEVSESEGSFRVQKPPGRKRRLLEVPVRIAKRKQKIEKRQELEKALIAIEKLIESKKNVFMAGRNSLQAYRARAIQSHLHMVIHNGRKHVEASERAAESQGFAIKWGGRLVRRWVKKWVAARELPESSRGSHGKAFSLLEDPAIRAELRSYLRSNKWSMDPMKLSEFVQGKSIPAAAEKYVRHLVDEEMPQGLKKYLELELFPRVQYRKVGKGVTLQTARNFLRKEGFKYTEHKKALYYDGHERPDVVQYRQEVFLPAMEQHRRRLVEFVIGDVEKELQKTPDNYVETRLVLVPHDEMTVQQNDGKKKSWVLDGEHALKKKGVGRGIHLSGIICATNGYIEDAGQTLEYGKNYEGYWTGELFVKQVSHGVFITICQV